VDVGQPFVLRFTRMESIGLIAGSGRLPVLFAEAAREKGLAVHAVGFEGEADQSALEPLVATLDWVKVGQAAHIVEAFRRRGVTKAVMAGGIGRIRSLTQARPDLGMLKIASKVRSMRDDELLRAAAAYFEEQGVAIVAATDYVPQVLAREGHLAGPKLSAQQQRDVEVGREVAFCLGRADVGQTVVVKDGVVLAVEAVEGTDECIRRAGTYGGPGSVVVKRCKPGQDLRFDLPTAGSVTLEVMREAGARVLAVEAGRTVLLDGALLFKWAERLGLSVVGFKP
jgi:DUF1009 family protein